MYSRIFGEMNSPLTRVNIFYNTVYKKHNIYIGEQNGGGFRGMSSDVKTFSDYLAHLKKKRKCKPKVRCFFTLKCRPLLNCSFQKFLKVKKWISMYPRKAPLCPTNFVEKSFWIIKKYSISIKLSLTKPEVNERLKHVQGLSHSTPPSRAMVPNVTTKC